MFLLYYCTVIMTFAGHRHREQEYGYLSYNHYIVLNLERVDSLVPTGTEALGTDGLTIPFSPAFS